MLTFHHTGDWPPGQVHATWVESSRPVIPEVEEMIERAWAEKSARPGIRLFDGPMCRLESWRVDGHGLHLALSPTSYKPFFGTNLSHPDLADRYGRAVLANPVGVSPALETADGFLLRGRRNDSLAYYPGRLHPFAGALEPGDRDLFAAVRRELAEELGLGDEDVAEVRCTGVAEDRALRQPELIFRVRSVRTREEVERRVDRAEHHASWAVPATEGEVARAAREPLITPVGAASLLLWGRVRFGKRWFEAAAGGIQRGAPI